MSEKTTHIHMDGANIGTQVIGDFTTVTASTPGAPPGVPAPALPVQAPASAVRSTVTASSPVITRGDAAGSAQRSVAMLSLISLLAGNLCGLLLIGVGIYELLHGVAADTSKVDFLGMTLESADRAIVLFGLGLISVLAVNVAALTRLRRTATHAGDLPPPAA